MKILLTIGLLINLTLFAQEVTRQQIEAVLEEFNLSGLNIQLPLEEINRQNKQMNNNVDFLNALRMALASFITDGESNESPKSLLIEFAFEHFGLEYEFPYSEQVEKRSQELVKQFMLQQSSVLSILGQAEQAEFGETTENYWIFTLYLGDLSDHYYWAIVDREGIVPTYNYGFN